MPQKLAQLSVADNLAKLARDFQSGDPVMASAIRKEFKLQSKNDLSRIVVYLMEVVGSRDEQFKMIQSDNKDLKEILELNNIKLDEEFEKLDAKEKADANKPTVKTDSTDDKPSSNPEASSVTA